MGIYWDFSGICMACAWWDLTNINQSYPISQFWVCLKTVFFRESEVFIDHPALTRNWGYAEFLNPLACAEKTSIKHGNEMWNVPPLVSIVVPFSSTMPIDFRCHVWVGSALWQFDAGKFHVFRVNIRDCPFPCWIKPETLVMMDPEKLAELVQLWTPTKWPWF
jgi:hypothetical protein